MLTVISLGAGVQSSTMALMAAHGEIEPMPDCAIFADTQAEPQHVYDWLNWLEERLPFPVHRVTAGDLGEAITQPNRGFLPVPFRVRWEDGSQGLMRRQCTREYKIAPIQKKLRELIGLKPRQRAPSEPVIEQWIGISLDEMQRMKDFGHKWGVNRFPLVDMNMRRWDCLDWMEKRQYPKPPRSACVFCPLMSNDEFRYLKESDSDSWKRAVHFDEAIRHQTRDAEKAEVFVHRSLVPLRDVDLDGPVEHGQLSFLDECDGMCGV